MKLDQYIQFFLCTSYVAGLFLCGGGLLDELRRRIALRRRLKHSVRNVSRRKIFLLMDRYLLAAGLQKIKGESFSGFMLLLFLSVFMTAQKRLVFLAALGVSLFAVSIPFLFLLVRIETGRTKGSAEGISMVTEFYRQYRMKNLNVLEALQSTVESDGSFPTCRRHLYSLLLRLRSEGDIQGIRRCTEDFSFALGTVWGRMFAVCVRLAAEQGADVSSGLADIVEQLRKANGMAEDRKRLNSEAARMTMFLVPVLYAGTMVLAVLYLNVPPGSLLRNQFCTSEGILFFSASVMLFFFNLLLLRLVGSTRMDY